MQVTTEKTKNRLILRAVGRFDAAGAKVVADALEQALTGGSHTVEIDMSAVDYLSSAGIRVLVTYYQKFTRLKGGLYLTGVNERISQLLEMTGLYNLLDNPELDNGTASGIQTLSFNGWTLASRTIEPDGRFVVQSIGWKDLSSPLPDDSAIPEVLDFPVGTLAFGTGALGYDPGECRGRYGPFLAAGGYAACRPLARDPDPDFEEFAEAYIPKLHVFSATVLKGNFLHHVSFESEVSAPGISELARVFSSLVKTPAGAFILAAECEVPRGDALFAGSRSMAGDSGPVLTAADGSRLCLVLAGGMTDAHGSIVRIHAALFSYQPLRRHGRVKLKETVDALFGQDLLDVVPLTVSHEKTEPSEIRLLRGLAWVAPVEDPK